MVILGSTSVEHSRNRRCVHEARASTEVGRRGVQCVNQVLWETPTRKYIQLTGFQLIILHGARKLGIAPTTLTRLLMSYLCFCTVSLTMLGSLGTKIQINPPLVSAGDPNGRYVYKKLLSESPGDRNGIQKDPLGH